jgi:hypothetical protein
MSRKAQVFSSMAFVKGEPAFKMLRYELTALIAGGVSMIETEIFTVGHSNHPTAHLRALLTSHGISAIADVRSSPYSRMNPQFNREGLRQELKGWGVSYAFLGVELGARTDNRSCYADGKVQYDRLGGTPLFQSGIERLLAGACKHRIALLCAEKDPLTCHRCILVARQLESRGVSIQHILADGSLESQRQALDRLLVELGMRGGDLFRKREELIEEAYRLRGEQIAYVEKPRSEAKSPQRAVR